MPEIPERRIGPIGTDVHGSITPEDVRETDPITSRIRTANDEAFVPVRIWAMSPLGADIVINENDQLNNADEIEIEIGIGTQAHTHKGFIVRPILKRKTSSGGEIVGIRFTHKPGQPFSNTEKRSSSRWVCSSTFDPTAIAPNPARFNDYIYFKIKDISKDGLRGITSLRNKFILPGMEFDLQISLPMTSNVLIRAKVARLSLLADSGKPALEVGFTFSGLGIQQRQAIGQYLIQFSDNATLESVREDGFLPASLSKGMDFSYIKSEAEYLAVLDLRLRANKAIGKVPKEYRATDMADIYDAKSRIIVAKFRGEIVGTIRVTFSEAGQKLEHEEYATLPSNFPRGHTVLECSRAATDPSYRGSDLWTNLLQHVAILALLAKREWALISTTEELVDMYCRIGFKR
ncbi:MAG: N-acyl amino acid synthase FeeM domain-containing protein, partial [Arenicellales bacterium]